MNGSTEHIAPATGYAVDCRADSAGGITFDIPCDGLPERAVLVLGARGGDGGGDGGGRADVRLPLMAADDGRRRAVLPSTVELAEGHWDVRCDTPEADEPLRTGVRDVRALVGRVPEAGPVSVRLPYPTADGGLAVRSWVREPHAEAGEIHCLPGAVTVEGVSYGTAGGSGGAVVEARLRGGGLVHRVPATGRGGVFAFTLPYRPLARACAGRRQWWDLWLVPGDGLPAARISRILDDVWDKRRWTVGPAHESAGVSALPCYTEDNGLSVRLEPAHLAAATS
ncbi:hypothetical protein [Streptomyces montanisoli]|uniref:Transferase n=1 Tax=Streptomyces montanisoli TaxID=2798581 RepID=A0A940MD61_9ACTN|nr:hypothetical protein [Streptomyces montanisoli]MBP0457790.1 hypothetical protein [Streptomyces montanisoli]